MKSFVRRLLNHPLFTPYYNSMQWHLRGKLYSQRDISSCYQKLYAELSDFVLCDNPSNVLEFGCGDAFLLRSIHARNQGIKLYGCDFSRTQLIKASTLLPDAIFEFQNIKSTTYADKAFDVAIGVGVLMYLNQNELSQALKELRRISRKVIIVEFSCRYFSEDKMKLFHNAKDGRFDYDYEKECFSAGFYEITARRCEHFWNPEINFLDEMGHSIVIASSERD